MKRQRILTLTLAVLLLGTSQSSIGSELELVWESSASDNIAYIDAIEGLDSQPGEIVFATRNNGAGCGGGTPASAWKLIFDPDTGDVSSVSWKQNLSKIQNVRDTLFESSDGLLFTGGGWCLYKPPYVSVDGGETWRAAEQGTHPPNSTFAITEFNGDVYAGTGYSPSPSEVYRWIGSAATDWAHVFTVPQRGYVTAMAAYNNKLFVGTNLYDVSCSSSAPIYVSSDGSSFNATAGIPLCYEVFDILVVNEQLVAKVRGSGNYYWYHWNDGSGQWELIAPMDLGTYSSLRSVASGNLLYSYGRAPGDSSYGVYQSDDMGQSWSQIATMNEFHVAMEYYDNALYIGTSADSSGKAYIYRIKEDDGPLAYYPFNGNANDESGNGHHGTVVGATPTTDRFGTPDSAYHFSDEYDYVNVSAGSFSLLSTSFTINSWVRVNDYKYNAFIRRNNHANYICSITPHDGKYVTAFSYAYSFSPKYVQLWGETQVNLNEWMMVTAVYDRDQGKVQLYYNGQLEDEASTPGYPVNDGNHPHEFGNWYGTRNSWNYEPFVGDLDDIRIYNRALSPEEVAALYDIDSDSDNDGINDSDDNCPDIANPGQENNDGDAEGDACDADDDNDTVLDSSDNCPLIVNADQADNDGDSLGDVCDDDDDNDGIVDDADNCKFTANADQADVDGDGQGDVCDGDQDGDGIANEADNCPAVTNADQADNDGDAQGDACDADDDNDTVLDTADNCPMTANADQNDLDGDNIGDACDLDIDGDGVENADDNCAWTANIDQEDTDGDNDGDACDDDDDNDGVLDAADNCSLIVNADQADTDGDGQGDVCDGDLDGDDVPNDTDNCPNAANVSQADFDSDGKGDACDEDVDGDDVPNDNDMCAFTPLDAIFSPEGCSINQLCPCEGPRGTTELWKNHGQYVSCIATSVNSFFEAKLITNADRRNVLRDAARSFCGKQAWNAIERRKQ